MLLDLTFDELEKKIVNDGFAKFRAKQVFDALYQAKGIENSNLPKEVKERYKEEKMPSIVKKLTGSDGTSKYLIKFSDGQMVESVLLKYSYGNTLCISTQVGCRMGCEFCASGLNGLLRNLTAGEILSQFIIINSDIGGSISKRTITNIVLMGSGEPLDNYDNVMKFLDLVCDKRAFNVSIRNISLSTCGIVPKIKELAESGKTVTLTISLHASNQIAREKIMKIAKRYDIKDIVEAAKYYFNKTGRRVIFEFALIKGINDSDITIEELANLLRGFPCHVNIIPLNPVKEKHLEGTSRKFSYSFAAKLEEKGLSATVRRTMGEDIEGACGQLRAKSIENGVK